MKQQTMKLVKQSFLLAMIGVLLFTSSCEEKDEVKTYEVKVQLVYPEPYQPNGAVAVKLTNLQTNGSFEAVTNAAGLATFTVNAGTYEISASETRPIDFNTIIFNGLRSGIIVSDAWTGETLELPLSESKTSQLVIKELYIGGCQKDDGSGNFQRDPYVILYNNSDRAVSLDNLSLGAPLPGNAHATNNFIANGELSYKNEGWIPAGFGIWSIQGNVSLDPGKQLVIAINNAVDNTVTYRNSINFAHAEYYCTYDIAVWNNTTYYPAPSQVIPSSHYLKAYKVAGATGNAWTLSVSSPAFFIFIPKGVTPEAFAANANNIVLHGTGASQVNLKTPVEWIVDGVEVYQSGQTASKKRLTDVVDAGYVSHTNAQGYTLYRNVDKEATEAIPGNAGKIVYGYNLGTVGVTVNNSVIEGGTTDPSGIDAEASIKAGARIIYKDTNNSTNDFHQRVRASLRD
jgi:hypothetical protein